GIICPQLDQEHIRLKVLCFLKLRFVPNRIVSFLKECAAADSEIFHFIRISQQCADLKRVAASIVTSGALRDAVADKGNFDRALSEGADRYKKCDDQDW